MPARSIEEGRGTWLEAPFSSMISGTVAQGRAKNEKLNMERRGEKQELVKTAIGQDAG